jgi:ariadne-1
LKCSLHKEWYELTSGKKEKVDLMWIKANTKTCPSCKEPIVKNEGCMHMTCRCKHEFCWLCLGSWKKHGSETGGFFKCNIYREDKHDVEQNSAKAKMKKY